MYLIWSRRQVAVSNPKERRHLKEHIGGQYRNSGSPDRRNPWGDGGLVLVRSLNKMNLMKGSRSISTKNSLPAGFEKLGKLNEDNKLDTNLVNKNLLKLVSDIDVLMAAYTKLKSSPGNLTPGIDKETLDGLNLKWFETLERDLNTNKFQFRPARRLEIPKANGKGTRPLGIASPRDKIVQGAILLVLEAIFEPSFSVHSHGFRPYKGCHSALGEIKRTYSSVNWFIEGDISNCFDTFDHKNLIKLIENRIKDKGFTDLLHKALKAGYMFQGQFFSPDLGTPQGSIVSPIICNILLNELDKFIEGLRLTFEAGTRRKVNPLWRRVSRSGNIKLIHKTNIGSRMHKDLGYKRLKYVRYADDFLLGVIGSKDDCINIRNSICTFLSQKLKLNLNLEKTNITNARDSIAHFLGSDIKITSLNKRPIKTITRGGTTYLSSVNTRPQLLAPVSKLVKKLESKGIAKPGGRPTRWGHMFPFEVSQIVKHYYTMWKGISNYYSFADNYGSLGRIHYILKYSCLLTLASKLRLETVKQTYKKFGKDINIIANNKIVASFPNESFAKPKKFHNTNISKISPLGRLEQLSKASFRTKQLFETNCTNCGAIENIEIHHVRKLRDSSKAIKADWLTSMMSRMNRKQIPLCKTCHINYHRGKLTTNKKTSL
jgi:group II intron reverse transcriptase/maturase